MRKIRIAQILLSALVIISLLSTTLLPTRADYSGETYPFELPIKPNTPIYLTATPKNHSVDGNRAAIDFQIPDELGFIDKGAPLYAPFDGFAQITKSPNDSLTLEIIKSDSKWKVLMAHIMDDTKAAQALIATFPKRVIQGDLIAYQGDSGYDTKGARFPVHVHFEIFKLVNGKYINDNRQIDICSKLNLKRQCKWIDDSGYFMYVWDK